LGAWLLEQARAAGVRLVRGKLVAVEQAGGRVAAVRVAKGGGAPERWPTETLVLAPGPYLPEAAALLGLELPVFNELHAKIALVDRLGLVPRDAPLLIWSDPVVLPWSAEERAELAGSPETRWLTEPMPAGVHLRPEGGADSPIVLILWTYDMAPRPAVWPPPLDPAYPDIVLRGAACLVPGLAAYINRAGRPYHDGGYYCKTRENRPLVGPLPVPGAYVLGALSGFGLMAAPAAGELLAAHVTGSPLPPHASAFRLERYADPAYQVLLERWGESGQL
jgi:glycine/D-amino acid oxidase-like deaminating enzyme